MVPENELAKQKVLLDRYSQRREVFDGICGLFSIKDIKKKYAYFNGELSFPVQSKYVKKSKVSPDMIFHSTSEASPEIVFIEQTFDNPLIKEEQIKGYIFIGNEFIQTTLNTHLNICKEIMIFVPKEQRTNAIKLFDKLCSNEYIKNNIGKKFGLTFWLHTKDCENFQKFAGTFMSPVLKKIPEGSVKVVNELKIDIYPTAPHIEILRFLCIYALENIPKHKELEIDRSLINSFLSKNNSHNIERIKETLRLGEKIGILKNVDTVSLCAELKYKKRHPSSLIYIKDFFADPISFAKKSKKDKDDSAQKDLLEW